MFKLKAGNVIQKMNHMSRKQAYTWGAIVIVCCIALMVLFTFMGDADDTSFDGFSKPRGYDLADLPFVNDEAEAFLLANKYPDMKNNGASLLFSQQEKEARQAEDEQDAQEGEEKDFLDVEGEDSGASGGSYHYSRGGSSGSSGGSTQIHSLGQASMSHSGGSGVSGSWGAPRGDFSPYQSQDKGTEIPPQLRTADARKALSQFAQTSRAAAGYKEGKAGNAKKALMGGNIRGSEAFTDNGVDLSKTEGLTIDPNAPISSPDLSNLDKDLSDTAQKDKDKKDAAAEAAKKSFLDSLREQLFSGLIKMGLNLAGNALESGLKDGISSMKGANRAGKDYMNNQLEFAGNLTKEQYDALSPKAQEALKTYAGGNLNWSKGNTFAEASNPSKFKQNWSNRNSFRNTDNMVELNAGGRESGRTIQMGRADARMHGRRGEEYSILSSKTPEKKPNQPDTSRTNTTGNNNTNNANTGWAAPLQLPAEEPKTYWPTTTN